LRVRIVVHEDSFRERPAYDTAVSRALLLAVGEGRSPAALRLYDPGDVVAFSLLDRVQPGFADAVAEARARGFDAVLRLAGGRAAVFTRETLGFAWCIPDPEPRASIGARFAEMAEAVAGALRALGADARVGAVPGEYCPGEHSVNARGATKLMGVGQRVIRGAAHVGGIVVVDRSDRIRAALEPVYAALDLSWNPATTGSVADEIGATSLDAVAAAIDAELAVRFDVVAGGVPLDAVIARAREIEGRFEASGAAARVAARGKISIEP
jgi:lipoate-protein ligase A